MNYKILRELIDEIYNEIETSLKNSKNDIVKYYSNYNKTCGEFFSVDITPKWKYTELSRYFEILNQVSIIRNFRKYYKCNITLSKEMEEALKTIEMKVRDINIIEADFYFSYKLEKRTFSFPWYHRLICTSIIKHPYSKKLSSNDITFKITITCILHQNILL